MFNKLKQIGQALSPDAIRQGLAASREAMANGGRLTPEQLATMTPEQRAQYDEAMARAQKSVDDTIANERARRVLLGPAGDHVYGPMPDREQMTSTDIGLHIAQAKDGFKQALRDTVKGRPIPPPPMPPVSANPAEQSAAERAMRDEARTPYLAPDRSPVVFTRIAADRKRPLEDLCAWLGTSGLAGRPDLVYGVARVPDHVPGKLGIGRAAIVEWEITHAALSTLPPAPPPTAVSFDARETWAARRPGEPSVLDEDLGVEYLRAGDLGPEQCLGIARRVAVDASGGSGGDDGGGSDPYVLAGVTGVVVLHPTGLAVGAVDRMRATRPLQVIPPPDLHVAVLNWLEIRRVVMPRTDKRPLVPSPFPYLPGTAAELLHAYLSIVGIKPRDCYSAQVTQDQPGNIIGGTAHTITTGADKEPAADGEMRKRFRGGSRVVVAYRDAVEYVAGRERWASYEREVLQAQLSVGTAVRAPVDKQSALDRGVLGALVRTAEVVGDVVSGYGWESTDFDKIPHHRYCWPPVQ
ncbi:MULTISPECIES: hypothetical protein [unclassified Nocardioides]|uniref:hypothetical protein n=1 Tax=unclassified Nocardioides TaxID=2615069 RepID=UPI0006FDE4AE|nr:MULTISPECIES: hypothetical protein [unclassified Nocardioides]KRA39039.1 hypothetical protein ASD81_10805 [Nocardioides sp. Root614]KRA92998.1 hypothetical protein ASD84_11070 [Nocardioides sp. Root682]